MSVMKRVTMIFRAKADKALDKMEDPRETLDYSYKQQLELLQKVRRGVADVATSRKRLELQMNQLFAWAVERALVRGRRISANGIFVLALRSVPPPLVVEDLPTHAGEF